MHVVTVSIVESCTHWYWFSGMVQQSLHFKTIPNNVVNLWSNCFYQAKRCEQLWSNHLLETMHNFLSNPQRNMLTGNQLHGLDMDCYENLWHVLDQELRVPIPRSKEMNEDNNEMSSAGDKRPSNRTNENSESSEEVKRPPKKTPKKKRQASPHR